MPSVRDHLASASPETSAPSAKRTVEELQSITGVLRRHIVTMIAEAGSGHPGGSLSAVEIVTALYFRVLRHRPDEPSWPERDAVRP